MKKAMVITLLNDNGNVVKALFNGYMFNIGFSWFYVYKDKYKKWHVIDTLTGYAINTFGNETRKDAIKAAHNVYDKFIAETQKPYYKKAMDRFKYTALIVDYR